MENAPHAQASQRSDFNSQTFHVHAVSTSTTMGPLGVTFKVTRTTSDGVGVSKNCGPACWLRRTWNSRMSRATVYNDGAKKSLVLPRHQHSACLSHPLRRGCEKTKPWARKLEEMTCHIFGTPKCFVVKPTASCRGSLSGFSPLAPSPNSLPSSMFMDAKYSAFSGPFCTFSLPWARRTSRASG